MQIRVCCKRCRCQFWLEPPTLSSFCGTCRRILGRRLTEYEQFGLNERWNYSREQLNAGGQDPLKRFMILNGGKK